MDAPTPPDPATTAAAQAQSNKETAITQYELGATNINSPTGKVTYRVIGTNPDGTPQYEQNVEYSPEEQALLDLKNQGLTTLGQAGVAQAGRVKDTLSTPFSLDASRAKQLSDINTNLLDPVWNQREQQLRTQLLNSGFREGDEGWNNAMRDLNDQRNRAYDQMFVDAYQTANNEALTERNLPLSELTQLLYGPTAPAPSATAPQPGVAPVDYTDLVSNLYKAQMQGYTGELGAIGSAVGSVGTALGGWAGGKASDRRVKADIELIGIDPRGWGIYLFRYIWERCQRVGYMADEVAIVRPDVVRASPLGFLEINYGAL